MSSDTRLQAFVRELSRRRVFRVAAAYAAVAFATISVASDFLPALGLPDWTVTVVAWSIVGGFPFSVALAWIYDLSPGGVRRTEAPAPGEAIPPSGGTRSRPDSRAAGFIGVGMIIALVFIGALTRYDALPLAGGGGSLPSIAALPFENVSDDPSNDIFSAGMHEEVLTQLYKLGGMTVISRTSVMQYRGTTRPLSEVARELGVGAILEASVRRDGNSVRVDARLIDPETDHQLWAERYDRELSDVLALQADIAEEIAGALRARLSPMAREQLAAARGRAVDPAMYEVYLEGLYHSGEGRHTEAIGSFERALGIDPEYAPAHAGVARSYYVLGFFGELRPGEAFGRQQRAATRAIELDPDLADAHATLALYRLHYDMDWKDADRLFRRALKLSPNHAQVRHDYAHYLLAAGRIEDSVAESARAAGLDPGNMMLMACAGWHGFTDHEYDRAVDQALQALMMMPGAFWPELILGWAYQHKGMYGPALASLRSAVTSSGGSPLAMASLAHALAAAGERTPARKVLDQLIEMARDRYVSAYDFAVVYAGLGQTDEAIAWLHRAHAERSGMLVNVGWDPRFDGIRETPRFRSLIEDMKLPDRPPPGSSPASAPVRRGM